MNDESSAYILSQTTFLLLYGQIMTIYDRKWSFFGAVVIFEVCIKFFFWYSGIGTLEKFCFFLLDRFTYMCHVCMLAFFNKRTSSTDSMTVPT